MRRAGLLFNPVWRPEHRKPLPMSPKGRGRIPRLAPGTGTYRGRAKGQRREAQEKGNIRGGLFFRRFLLAGQKKSTRGAGDGVPAISR